MPVTRLTKNTVDAIPFSASGQVIYKDSQLKGFGLKVGTGTKTYIAEGSPNGRSRLVTIGRHGVITTEQARKKAQAILQDMREGIDPNKVKKQARAKQLTLAEAAEIYLDAPKVRAPATLAEYRATLQRYFRDWLARPLSEITRKDCYDRHRKIGKERGTYAANGAMRMIRATYNRALKQFEDLPPVNPVIAVDWFPEEVRDAAIAAEDLAEWYQGIHRLPNPIRTDYYLFVLLSGLRRRSAAVMRWEHVDLRAGTLFIPEPKGGKKRAFRLPLSDMMVDVLAKRREQNMIFFGADNPWVWPAASRPGHMVEPKLSDNDEKLVKVPFTIHGLRHTFATCANAAGIGVYDLKLLMNHALSGDVTTVYISSGEHLRRAQQKVTDYISSWMLPQPKSKARTVAGSLWPSGGDTWSPADIWRAGEEGVT